jgi:hypothetical protein
MSSGLFCSAGWGVNSMGVTGLSLIMQEQAEFSLGIAFGMQVQGAAGVAVNSLGF